MTPVATSRLRLGQTIERARDQSRARVHMIYRVDREVLLDDGSEGRIYVSFTNLRRYWREVA